MINMPPTPPTDTNPSALSIDDPVTADWIHAAILALQKGNTMRCVVGVDAPVLSTEPATIIVSAIVIPSRHAQRSCQAITSLHKEIIEGSRLLDNR